MEKMKSLDAPYLSKNPKITFAFEKLDLSERRGLGFTTIRTLPTEHKLPLPVVTFDNPFLVFEFSRSYDNGNHTDNRINLLSSNEGKGFDFIKLNSPVTRKSYEEHFGVSRKTAERHLSKLVSLNLINRVGAGPATSYSFTSY